ncbi:MAG: hypothetical protein PWP46_102 [Fusobacteriaceae bacterium]|jgi:response regulator RpfG family c-di-GMP phosphodiesterase|nr:response regulator receiver modulated metal dependent phosphohydrolase [Fusobacteriales bacterium]MDN5303223.1 hypothetical protein [Fusobacteriaceae bacterium]
MSKRVYKEAWTPGEVFNYIRNQKGKMFDPYLVDIVVENWKEILQLRERYK